MTSNLQSAIWFQMHDATVTSSFQDIPFQDAPLVIKKMNLLLLHIELHRPCSESVRICVCMKACVRVYRWKQ